MDTAGGVTPRAAPPLPPATGRCNSRYRGGGRMGEPGRLCNPPTPRPAAAFSGLASPRTLCHFASSAAPPISAVKMRLPWEMVSRVGGPAEAHAKGGGTDKRFPPGSNRGPPHLPGIHLPAVYQLSPGKKQKKKKSRFFAVFSIAFVAGLLPSAHRVLVPLPSAAPAAPRTKTGASPRGAAIDRGLSLRGGRPPTTASTRGGGMVPSAETPAPAVKNRYPRLRDPPRAAKMRLGIKV